MVGDADQRAGGEADRGLGDGDLLAASGPLPKSMRRSRLLYNISDDFLRAHA